jgi:hypothetical protein
VEYFLGRLEAGLKTIYACLAGMKFQEKPGLGRR